MKTAKESFIEYNPTAKDWDKFDWEITNFNADYMLAFAEYFADQQNKEKDAEIQRLTKECASSSIFGASIAFSSTIMPLLKYGLTNET